MRLLAKVVAGLAVAGILYLVLGTVVGTTLRVLFERDPVEEVKERFAANCGAQPRIEKLECARAICEIALRDRELLPHDLMVVEWSSSQKYSDNPARSDHIVKFKTAGVERFAKCEMRNSDLVSVQAAVATDFR